MSVRDDVAAFLEREPDASANKIARETRHRRADVQAVVRTLRPKTAEGVLLLVRGPQTRRNRYPSSDGPSVVDVLELAEAASALIRSAELIEDGRALVPRELLARLAAAHAGAKGDS